MPDHKGLDPVLAARLNRVHDDLPEWNARGIEIVSFGLGKGDVLLIAVRNLTEAAESALRDAYGSHVLIEDRDHPTLAGGTR